MKNLVRKYSKELEKVPELKAWITENTDPVKGGKAARCKVCKVNLRAHRSDLIKHSQTKIHKDKIKGFSNQRRLTTMGAGGVRTIGQEAKAADLRLTAYIVAHSSLRSMDHLGELLNALGKGSTLETLRLHRTKCTKLAVNVIAPAMLEDLVADINASGCGYSLIADESTDVGVLKYLCLMVRYFSASKKAIVVDFLGLLEIVRGTAVALFDATIGYLESIDLRPEECIGIGSDGASNMVGSENSFFALFKQRVNHIQLIKCTCHSLHLCASDASKKLPEELEFLVRETRNWFSKSAIRRDQYEGLHKAMNGGAMPRKLVQLVRTRWLAWSSAIDVLLKQWTELKCYFRTYIETTRPSEQSPVVQSLDKLFQAESTHLFLLFVHPLTQDMQRVNVMFQSKSAEVTELFSELRILVVKLAKMVLKPQYIKLNNQTGQFLTDEDFKALTAALEDPSAQLPLDDVDSWPTRFTVRLGSVQLSVQEVKGVKKVCREYLVQLCKELCRRLPDSITTYENVRYFSVAEATRTGPSRRSFWKMPWSLAEPGSNLDALQGQWDELVLIDWKARFGGEVPRDSTAFWVEVLECLNASGEPRFKELARFALRVLSLPFSNADVERAFSVMNTVKNKLRNRMSVALLAAILRIRLHFRATRGNNCCTNFVPSERMFQLFNAGMYDPRARVGGAEEQAEDDPEAFEEALNLFAFEEDGGWEEV